MIRRLERVQGENRLVFDPEIGAIVSLDLGAVRNVLHRAPWADEDVSHVEGITPGLAGLSGDFLCAPFGTSDVEPAPAHGFPANSAWDVDSDEGILAAALEHRVMGAQITKRLALSPGAPVLYQEHFVAGGSGGLTIAHHPMVRITGSARFATSPKRAILTDAMPLEPGRHRLAPETTATDLSGFPGADGTPVDLTHLPIGTAHEDFVTLLEAEGATLGWTAVTRVPEGDTILILKDPRALPITMLWHSNGGRDHAPWNGRHTGVLGIEDGRAGGSGGHRAALGPTSVSRLGVPTTLALDANTTHRIAHAIVAFETPDGFGMAANVAIEGDMLLVSGTEGARATIGFDGSFFAR